MHALKELRQISVDVLEDRIETVRELESGDNERYAIVKDKPAGDHYLHYRYRHLYLATRTEEWFHHLLPVSGDEVLGMLFAGERYPYPDAWDRPYLRSGDGDSMVWFDPSADKEIGEDERLGQDISDLLAAFKKEGDTSSEAVDDMLRRIDQLREQRDRGKDPS